MSDALEVRVFRHGEEGTREFRMFSPKYVEPVPEGTECRLVLRDGKPVARCSVFLVEGMHGAEGTTGLIGHFEAKDEEAARCVLDDARRALFERGALRVLGPMNGSTWSRYRFALPESGDSRSHAVPFAGEPTNPAAYPDWFLAAGATEVARYESRFDHDPSVRAADADVLAARVRDAGIQVRSLDPRKFFELELRIFHELSLASFAGNLYYTPVDWQEFRAQYMPLEKMLHPGLVLIAESASGEPIAFQFAYMDPIAARFKRSLRAIVKTVATAPAARGMGLAGHMLDILRERAAARGATSVIHALMHVDNFSMKMSSRHATRVFRRYALYEWRP